MITLLVSHSLWRCRSNLTVSGQSSRTPLLLTDAAFAAVLRAVFAVLAIFAGVTGIITGTRRENVRERIRV